MVGTAKPRHLQPAGVSANDLNLGVNHRLRDIWQDRLAGIGVMEDGIKAFSGMVQSFRIRSDLRETASDA